MMVINSCYFSHWEVKSNVPRLGVGLALITRLTRRMLQSDILELPRQGCEQHCNCHQGLLEHFLWRPEPPCKKSISGDRHAVEAPKQALLSSSSKPPGALDMWVEPCAPSRWSLHWPTTTDWPKLMPRGTEKLSGWALPNSWPTKSWDRMLF